MGDRKMLIVLLVSCVSLVLSQNDMEARQLQELQGLQKRSIQDGRFYIYTDVNKNASLIITDFLAMVYKNEQPHTACLCRGWAKLENDLNLICR